MEVQDAIRSSNSLKDIITEAKKYILIVSPYNKINKKYHILLADADARNIPILFICRKDSGSKNSDTVSYLRGGFKDFKNVNLYSVERLHTKLYMNEEIGLLTSMNFHESSQVNNWELGIFFDKYNSQIWDNILSEVNFMLKSSTREIMNIENFKFKETPFVEYLAYYLKSFYSSGNISLKQYRDTYNNREYTDILIDHIPMKGIQTVIKYDGKYIYTKVDGRYIEDLSFTKNIDKTKFEREYELYIGDSKISIKCRRWVKDKWNSMTSLEQAEFMHKALKLLYGEIKTHLTPCLKSTKDKPIQT